MKQTGSVRKKDDPTEKTASWARKHLHRASLWDVSRCRHAALDRLLRPTETSAGNPDHCRMIDDSPNYPGVANAWDSSDARGTWCA